MSTQKKYSRIHGASKHAIFFGSAYLPELGITKHPQCFSMDELKTDEFLPINAYRAFYRADKLKFARYNKGRPMPEWLEEDTVYTLADKYYLSHDFKNLRDETKAQYKYFMGVFLSTEIDGTCIVVYALCESDNQTQNFATIYGVTGNTFCNHIIKCTNIFNFYYAWNIPH